MIRLFIYFLWFSFVWAEGAVVVDVDRRTINEGESVTLTVTASNMSENKYVAGYVNTTTALTRVQFKMSSGNIDAGTIQLFGVL